MNKLQNYIEQRNEKTLILSLDLDNTLVNRDIGGNWVFPKTVELLKKIKKQNKIKLLINTGREQVGYLSFCKQTININNAILGSGSIILINGKTIFNKQGKIEQKIINYFKNAVRQGILPFVDFSHIKGRTLYFNDELTKKEGLKDFFYSQNPKDWFGNKIPPFINIKNKKILPKNIFRIEFPISNNQKIIYEKISSKNIGAINYLTEILGTNYSINKKYTLKKKAFFNDKFKDKYTFARLEHNSELINKGVGLVNWLEQSKLLLSNVSIIHIGDKDSGIIDDTLVKRHIANAFMIMVGNKNRSDNPNIDLYTKGSVDQAVFNSIKLIYKLTKTKK